jgi:Xaa-Pro aminopeptidase
VLAAGEGGDDRAGHLPAGRARVRIEDLVVVAEKGCRNLSGLPKELQLVE